MSNTIPSQLSILQRDKWLLSCLTWVPILLAFSIWVVFSQGIARDLPIGVVDFSNSQLSKQLTRYYDATSAMEVHYRYASVEEAKDALVKQKIYAYAVIPSNFDKQVYKQQMPQVSVFYNSQMILVGKLINSAFQGAQGTFNAKLNTIGGLTKGNTTLASALGGAVPVRTQITPLFNKNSNYAQFLVSAIIPALWQIIIVVTTILILAANHREHGLVRWLGDSPTTQLIATLSRYLPLFWLQGIGFLFWFYQGLDWPFNGNISVLIIAQLFTAIACMAMGCLFFFLTLDAARAMSFAGAFTAPSFAFMGITFPVTDMSQIAQTWRNLLPISHYIEAQVSQVSYGQEWQISMTHLIPMLGYAIPFTLALVLLKNHLRAELSNQGVVR